MSRAAGPLAFLLLLGATGGCADPLAEEAVTNVLTLQSGTMSELRARRGTGPFREYGLAPDVMAEVLGEALRKARGVGGEPLAAIWVKPHRGEVYAKERTPAMAADDSYDGPLLGGVIVFVHPVRGRSGASRIEVHEMQRGPFHRGAVRWRRDLPGWIEEALSERLAAIPAAPEPDVTPPR